MKVRVYDPDSGYSDSGIIRTVYTGYHGGRYVKVGGEFWDIRREGGVWVLGSRAGDLEHKPTKGNPTRGRAVRNPLPVGRMVTVKAKKLRNGRIELYR